MNGEVIKANEKMRRNKRKICAKWTVQWWLNTHNSQTVIRSLVVLQFANKTTHKLHFNHRNLIIANLNRLLLFIISECKFVLRRIAFECHSVHYISIAAERTLHCISILSLRNTFGLRFASNATLTCGMQFMCAYILAHICQITLTYP